jgi:peptide/nickel transport system substrate-binding protein/oligopeptide transport system substrate-binding protein
MLFDGLVTLDKNLEVKAWAAKSWTISSDGTTYVFTLQSNQKFSDGTAVKPSDFAWSIDRSANPCLGSQLSYYLSTIKDASAFSGETCTNDQPVGAITTLVGDSVIPDDSANTLTIKLAQPAGYFLEALTYSTSFAVEKSVVSGAGLGKDDTWLNNLAKGATGQGGSGMFYVSAWDHQGVLTLKQNPNWWGTKPNFTTVDFKLFSSTDTEYSTYQTDTTLAYTDTIPVLLISAAKGQPDYHQQPTLIEGGFMMNWKIAPFDDVNARKAFCLAINRDQLNTSIAKGTQIPSWHIVPKGMPGYNENLKGLEGAPTAGDATKAKALWATYLAAHGNKVPPIKLSFNLSSNTAKLSAEAYQATWNQTFGINTTIDQTAWATILQEEQSKTLQLYRFAWAADYPDPEDWLTLLFSSDSPYNEQNASIPAADALMKQADGLADMSQRVPLYNQAEQMLLDQVAWCPTSQYQNYYRVRTWVKGGFVQTAQGSFPLPVWQTAYIANH